MFFPRDESRGYKIAHACGILFYLMDVVLWPAVQTQVPIGTAEFATPGFIPAANMPTPPQECQRHETSVTGGILAVHSWVRAAPASSEMRHACFHTCLRQIGACK
jgi:hypothetical protein